MPDHANDTCTLDDVIGMIYSRLGIRTIPLFRDIAINPTKIKLVHLRKSDLEDLCHVNSKAATNAQE